MVDGIAEDHRNARQLAKGLANLPPLLHGRPSLAHRSVPDLRPARLATTARLSGDLANTEPKTLRHRLLHTAARSVRGQRRRRLEIPETWPTR